MFLKSLPQNFFRYYEKNFQKIYIFKINLVVFIYSSLLKNINMHITKQYYRMYSYFFFLHINGGQSIIPLREIYFSYLFIFLLRHTFKRFMLSQFSRKETNAIFQNFLFSCAVPTWNRYWWNFLAKFSNFVATQLPMYSASFAKECELQIIFFEDSTVLQNDFCSGNLREEISDFNSLLMTIVYFLVTRVTIVRS